MLILAIGGLVEARFSEGHFDFIRYVFMVLMYAINWRSQSSFCRFYITISSLRVCSCDGLLSPSFNT